MVHTADRIGSTGPARKGAPVDPMQLRFGHLKFEPALEAAYAAERFAASRQFVRANLLILMAIMVVIFVTDRIVMPGIWDLKLLAARLAYMLPALALAFAATFVPRADRWYPRVAAVVAIGMLVAVSIAGLLAWQHGEGRLIVRPIYAAIAIYFMLGLGFRIALVVNILGISVYAGLAAIWAGLPGEDLLFSVSTLLLTNVLCVAGAYKLEYLQRAAWLKTRQLEGHALRDGLTGLSNRRRFDEQFERIWRQAQRDGILVSLLLVDIDHFKKFNDRYGHQAGDEALKSLAGVLSESARRPMDVAARFGGEEFTVLLFDAGRAYAVRTAQSIMDGLRDAAIPHADSPTGRLTVSIGIATVVPVVGRSPAGLLQLADQALYGAKDAGRNQLFSLDPEYEHLQTGHFDRSIFGVSGPVAGQ